MKGKKGKGKEKVGKLEKKLIVFSKISKIKVTDGLKNFAKEKLKKEIKITKKEEKIRKGKRETKMKFVQRKDKEKTPK